MNNRLLVVLLLALGLSNCTKENNQHENLNFEWTLVEYSNIQGEVYCTYDEGDVIWNFEGDKLSINGRLITPFEFTPCYKIDPNEYEQEFTFVIDESNTEDTIFIEDLNLTAKITVGEENLVLEIISSTEFKPSTNGVKVFYKKI